MRRGLMSWSPEEMPVAVLDERVARLQTAMQKENLAAVLVYTSFAQPAAVHWLTNFTPYWSEALLVVMPEGVPVLLAALTQRVHGWIREVAHLSNVISAPRLGEGAQVLLDQQGVHISERIGVVGLDSLPWSLGSVLIKDRQDGQLVDVSELFAAMRQPGDSAELTLARRAAAIGKNALAAAPQHAQSTSELAAVLEASARLAGAEEVLQRVAPDLQRNAALVRLEGELPLGSAYAVELSLAYKGVWVRMGCSFSRTETEPSWKAAEEWFANSIAGLSQADQWQPAPAPGILTRWSLETSTGLHPLSVVAASDSKAVSKLPAGSLAVFSAHLENDGGHWFRSAPVVLGKVGVPGKLLI